MNEKLFNKASKADFSKILINKGYAYFNKGKYNLNIIGIRNAGNNVTNKFDDVIVVEYIDMYGIKSRNIFAATTEPGITSMTKPVSYKGCAILVPVNIVLLGNLVIIKVNMKLLFNINL